MKNQYFGDINDCRKQGLLWIMGRLFDAGVYWMRMVSDQRVDGRFINFPGKPEKWRSFDPD